MTLSTDRDYTLREHVAEQINELREQNDGDESVFTPRISDDETIIDYVSFYTQSAR